MNTVSVFTVRRSFLRLRHSTSLRLHPEAGRDSIFFVGRFWLPISKEAGTVFPFGEENIERDRMCSGFRQSFTFFAVWRRACGFPY